MIYLNPFAFYSIPFFLVLRDELIYRCVHILYGRRDAIPSILLLSYLLRQWPHVYILDNISTSPCLSYVHIIIS